ncbi:uncharacterized protein [Ptychodera flava]|uniref:uncharacterized protein n=1 Tax=Ptychodera flava TaxID=63121 RepID=UPI00396A5FAA
MNICFDTKTGASIMTLLCHCARLPPPPPLPPAVPVPSTSSTTQRPHPSTMDTISKSSTFSSYFSTPASTTTLTPSSGKVSTATTTNVSTLKTGVSTHEAITLTWSRSTASSLTSIKLETPATTEQSSPGNSIIVLSVVGALALLVVALIIGVILLRCRRKKLREGQDANNEYTIPGHEFQTETANVGSLPISADQSGYTDLVQGNRLPEHAYQSLTPRGNGNHPPEDSYTELRNIPVSLYQSLGVEDQASDHDYWELTHDTERRTDDNDKLKPN